MKHAIILCIGALLLFSTTSTRAQIINPKKLLEKKANKVIEKKADKILENEPAKEEKK